MNTYEIAQNAQKRAKEHKALTRTCKLSLWGQHQFVKDKCIFCNGVRK